MDDEQFKAAMETDAAMEDIVKIGEEKRRRSEEENRLREEAEKAARRRDEEEARRRAETQRTEDGENPFRPGE